VNQCSVESIRAGQRRFAHMTRFACWPISGVVIKIHVRYPISAMSGLDGIRLRHETLTTLTHDSPINCPQNAEDAVNKRCGTIYLYRPSGVRFTIFKIFKRLLSTHPTSTEGSFQLRVVRNPPRRIGSEKLVEGEGTPCTNAHIATLRYDKLRSEVWQQTGMTSCNKRLGPVLT